MGGFFDGLDQDEPESGVLRVANLSLDAIYAMAKRWVEEALINRRWGMSSCSDEAFLADTEQLAILVEQFGLDSTAITRVVSFLTARMPGDDPEELFSEAARVVQRLIRKVEYSISQRFGQDQPASELGTKVTNQTSCKNVTDGSGGSSPEDVARKLTDADSNAAASLQTSNVSQGAVRKKRSTAKGEARERIIAAVTKHHKYEDGSCLNQEPIGVNELARMAKTAPSSASAFFKQKFKGHTKYRRACLDVTSLAASLKMLNAEFSPWMLYGSTPPEGDCADED